LTVTLVSRMHGRPVILAGSIVIRSYATSLKVRQPAPAAPARCVAAALCLAYTSAAMGVYCGSGDVCRDDVSGVAVQGGPGPLWRMVVRGSACEAASCTSLSGTPASSAAVMNACRHASPTAWCRKLVTSQVTTGSSCTRPGRTPDSSGCLTYRYQTQPDAGRRDRHAWHARDPEFESP
jgi:hypothetical protein